MIRKNDHPYSAIDSFEDFRLERQRLILKGRLIETKINLNILYIRKAFSVTGLVLSLAKKYLLPGLSDFLGFASKKEEN